MSKKELKNPEYYYNRELSWLKFDARVLSEAKDPEIGLFERIKFLSITASNLDEFFMIRVASLKDMVNADYRKADIAGLTAREQLDRIDVSTHKLVLEQYDVYNSLLDELKDNGLIILDKNSELSGRQAKFIEKYFMSNVYPVLTPMAVDSSRPFPLIRNKSLNIGAIVHKKDDPEKEIEFATVQVPSVLQRVIEIPSSGDVRTVILLEDMIEMYISKLFLHYDIVSTCQFRIMRNADLTIDEDEAADLLKEIERQIKKRQWGEVIRLEIDENCDEQLVAILKNELVIKEEDIYYISGPLDLTFLMKIYGMEGYDALKAEPHIPSPVYEIRDKASVFDAIREKDILMHHPYESFEPVVDFIKEASVDPNVLAIKQTLYRVSGNSPIIAALATAAENGKQVTVLVELKARFDEENNIVWARKLEHAGCHVIYGLVGLKTHSKITLVVRKEDDGIRRYVHLGTGNYNDATAKLYTDIGLFTCRESFGEDATAVFNMLSGYSEPEVWNKLSLAPLWLKDKFLELIDREKKFAKKGKPAHIIAKLNSLCDQDIIKALYEASIAGVKIELIVRGICCLKVGIPGVSENITVRSIIGNFLEHSRIFYFENNGMPEVYCGSADWMPRNLERRVEILFPIEQGELKRKVYHILDMELKDNVKSHILMPDGTYVKEKNKKERLNSQELFVKEARKEADKHIEKEVNDFRKTRRFTVETHVN
ncbi:MAG: RNA degradosome polyphosphate kinase [Lachnospiraceae bacterium]|nr:RNA degradosome polyphosphate kinase [Lachnospiraceae bacterium]